MPEHTELALRLAYDEAIRKMERQEAKLDEVRSRAQTLVTAAGLAAAFVGIVGKPTNDPDNFFFGLGLALFAVGFVLAILMWLPRKGWSFGFSAKVVYEDALAGAYKETDPRPTILKDVTCDIEKNELNLDNLYTTFKWQAGVLGLSFVSLIASVVLSTV